MRIYLDNCCYNRPYDDQSQTRVRLEADAKMQIQHMIRNGELELATSFVLDYENNLNRSEQKKQTIRNFMKEFEFYYVDESSLSEIERIAEPIMATGIKSKDAWHLACALIAECDYFISTDKRLLKYKTDKITSLTPVEFMYKWRN